VTSSRRLTLWVAIAAAVMTSAPATAVKPGRGHQATATVAAPRKHVLAWADVRNGYQHDSISHAVATIEQLGRQTGAYDTFIRTDSQLITKHPITFAAGTGIAARPEGAGGTREAFNVRNLDYFDAIFFFGVREIDLSADQRADLISFVKEDGKGFVAAHSAATAFFSWPEFGEMVGGRFDEHPWGVAHLDPDKLDLTRPLVHRKDGDFPAAWARTYGRGRVFYSIFGHDAEAWDNPALAKMYFEAIRWALRLVDGDATPSSFVSRQ
jgi:hypothetical protein